MRSSINDDKKELATRTFANHVAAIADIFGIDIVCDRSDNTYRIENEGDIGGSGIHDWLMEALSLNNLINESAGLRTRLLFESEPSSHRFLTDIIRAIRDERMIEINYQSFKMEAPRDFLLEPFCLKEYKRRWYLFARDHNGGYKEPHSFALDRMNTVAISEQPFTVPKSFNTQTFFSTRYGVLQYEGEKPAHIKLKVCARQANYFRTLPLHSSQKETEKTAEYSIFSYYLTPNYDFIHDVLYYADDVEVLEPASLRETFETITSNLNRKYNG
ncbi:MAG: WYL domain-containing protein [Bacteroidales bacterium]|nr:WYL domain-containing protein [Bacteroidales bacterium]